MASVGVLLHSAHGLQGRVACRMIELLLLLLHLQLLGRHPSLLLNPVGSHCNRELQSHTDYPLPFSAADLHVRIFFFITPNAWSLIYGLLLHLLQLLLRRRRRRCTHRTGRIVVHDLQRSEHGAGEGIGVVFAAKVEAVHLLAVAPLMKSGRGLIVLESSH